MGLLWPLWMVTGAVFSAVFASYGGVVAERGWAGSADGRSVCVCGRQLHGIENIPVVSYALLRGRSRCCGAVIPSWYVLTEAGAAVMGGLAGALLGPFGAAAAPVGTLLFVAGWGRRRTRRSWGQSVR
jgi:prepilin signal peptidase PulO-like enzyme (type II secretory pathway)